MANKSIYDAFERMWQHLTAVAGGKSDKNHNHDDLYYTESEVDNLLSNIDVSTSINEHNVSTEAHNDVRLLIEGLTTRLNALANSDDTTLDQMAEVVAYIKANRDLIGSVTTDKVNVDDIIDNLTTNVTNKPLSAAQGVALKSLIDALTNTVNGKANSSDLTSHINNKNNPHGVTASQVGLGNVNNTSDADKPVSTAQATAIADAKKAGSDAQTNLNTHIDNKNNPHSVTASQVGLGNVNNTSDANKPVSTAQATAIADAKKAGTDAQTNLDTHVNNKSNPHGVTLSQLGVTASAAELNYVKGVTSNIQTQLNNKLGDYSIELYNGTAGNPKPVRFASFNYSTCNSENGISAKIGMVSGHGNGSSYAFLQDVIIKVSHLGTVSVDSFKYYGASAGTYDGAARQYGDIFWLHDETNKIIDFYVLMGQYARVQQTPWKRLTYSSGGTVTQHTSCTVYSSGMINWGNNAEITLSTDLADLQTQLDGKLPISGGTMTGELVFNGGDVAGGSKIVLATGEGQITNSGTQTLFGFVGATTLAVGHNSYAVNIRGNATRPLYNSKEIALLSDVPTITSGTDDLTAGSSALATGALYFVYE